MPLPVDIEDLLIDDSFLAWYLKTNEDDISKWESLIANNPALSEKVADAIDLLEKMRLQEKAPDNARINQAMNRLMNTIGDNSRPAKVVSTSYRKRMMWAAAAVIILLAGFTFWQYYSVSGKLSLRTQYGEIRKESLPDGSQVTLNANTEIAYSKEWSENKDREVWLNGEAFFEVQKTAAKNRFIVHSEAIDIVVTGTRFNVNNRGDKNNVLLNEGSVTIKSANNADIYMKPGDFVEYFNSRFHKKEVDNSLQTTWKDHKLIFEKTPMREVAESLKEIYGVSVLLADDSVAIMPVSGIFPNDNLDFFLKSLEISQNFGIEKKGREILIKRK